MSFALITGASRGIGKAIAIEFAKQKKDVLLVARNADMLKQLSGEIESTYKVRAHYFPIDLAGDNAPDQILQWVKQNDFAVDVLVNNAGYGLSGPFEQHAIDQHMNMMSVNMNAVVKMTWLFLPRLRQEKKSWILNIASSAGYQATPFLSVYSASKAFVINFSRGLHRELKGSNVSLTCVSPGTTDTGFNDRAQIGKKARDLAEKVKMPADAVAKMAVTAMYNERTEVITGALNKLGAFMVWLLPKKFIENTAAKIYQ